MLYLAANGKYKFLCGGNCDGTNDVRIMTKQQLVNNVTEVVKYYVRMIRIKLMLHKVV